MVRSEYKYRMVFDFAQQNGTGGRWAGIPLSDARRRRSARRRTGGQLNSPCLSPLGKGGRDKEGAGPSLLGKLGLAMAVIRALVAEQRVEAEVTTVWSTRARGVLERSRIEYEGLRRGEHSPRRRWRRESPSLRSRSFRWRRARAVRQASRKCDGRQIRSKPSLSLFAYRPLRGKAVVALSGWDPRRVVVSP
jgi:hypothetical protein